MTPEWLAALCVVAQRYLDSGRELPAHLRQELQTASSECLAPSISGEVRRLLAEVMP